MKWKFLEDLGLEKEVIDKILDEGIIMLILLNKYNSFGKIIYRCITNQLLYKYESYDDIIRDGLQKIIDSGIIKKCEKNDVD